MQPRAAILLSLGRTPFWEFEVDVGCADPCFIRGHFQVMK